MDEKEKQFAAYWTEKRKTGKAAFVKKNTLLMSIWVTLILLVLRLIQKGFDGVYARSWEFLLIIATLIVWNAIAGFVISQWMWNSNEKRLKEFENRL
jgi:hypothetical protein